MASPTALLRAPRSSFRPLRNIATLSLLTLAACNPAPADGPSERVVLDRAWGERHPPIASPDTSDAVWSPGEGQRLLFGNVGARPFLSIACESGGDGAAAIRFVRHIASDPEAGAMMALVGNGAIGRIAVDSTWRGDTWRWEGTVPADDAALDAITGQRALTVTMPGAGTLELPPSARPSQLIARCRLSQAHPPPPPLPVPPPREPPLVEPAPAEPADSES